MSEEEKKAIKWFNTERKLVEITNSDNNYFSIILNLIDKLQKENKELKEKNKKLKRENEALEIIHETYKEVVDNLGE